MSPDSGKTRRLAGQPAAPGVARARALVHDPGLPSISLRFVEESERPGEAARFREALEATLAEIDAARDSVTEQLGEDHARIFEAHRLILEDELLLGQVKGLLEEGMNAEGAWTTACERVQQAFLRLPAGGPDRFGDLRDLQRRLLRNLLGHESRAFEDLDEEVIVVARDLSPSDTVTLDRSKVLGFALEQGGPTSHSVILGRSLGIPVVTGAEGLLEAVGEGDPLILDGHSGQIVAHPGKRELQEFEDLQEVYGAWEREMLRFKDFPAETRDGRRLELLANIEVPEEVEGAREQGAAGIGLYRTEYLFLTRQDFPGEEEQYRAYREVLETLDPEPVIIRSMDLGGDKVPAYLRFPREENPHMGWRGIRYALGMPEVFRTQLRAILRAGVHGQLRLMFPMVSSVEELRAIRGHIDAVKEQLAAEGKPHATEAQIGVMIETPAAVAIAHLLAREVQFLSIGTNDLVQFSLAMDRNNPQVSHLYDPFHPAILRQIRRTVKAGHGEKNWVGLCGEMPEDPLFVILMIGIGLDELSTAPYRIPEIKRIIRSVTYDQARRLVKTAWRGATAAELRRQTRVEAVEMFPELAEMLLRWETP